ncbi:MAG TPA: serine hydrolase domain-containing protein [Gemmatimonadaceae bacterium]|nr:serine hydrolase domain-containing protein [Gemmatimonadaceae bacterium]
MRHLLRTVAPLLVAGHALAAALPAQAARATPPAARPAAPPSTLGVRDARLARTIDRARSLVRDSVAALALSGYSIAVAVDGRIVWSEGFGWADIENRIPLTPRTRLRVGSVSKPLTAAAVALLVERGRLDLDTPVQRYVPDFPVKRWPITTRQLGGHLAGIRHYAGDEMMSMRAYPTVHDGLAIFRDDSLLHEPGTKYAYSSYGWNLISAVVEGASGEPFLPFMRANVFEPLGMRETIAEFPDSIIPNRARFYVRDGMGPYRNAPYVDNSYKWAGGGFLSTTEDLVRFGSAMLRPGFLSAASHQWLFTSQRTTSGEETGYGFGWDVERDADGRQARGHSGGSVGANAMLLVYPETRVVVAVLGNTTTPFVGAGARHVARLFNER